MTRPRYFCLDDFQAANQYSLVINLNRLRDVTIDHKKPSEVRDAVEYVSDGQFDGVLLDLVLEPSGSSLGARKISHAFAQSLRDRANLRLMRDVPIVLWSSQQKIRRYLFPDRTGQDLYDLMLDKAKISDERRHVSKQLLALATGYRDIEDLIRSKRKRLQRMLRLETTKAATRLDQGITKKLEGVLGATSTTPPHGFALFILRDLLGEPRPLVDESLLAARLGVETAQRRPMWNRLLRALRSCAYRGVFREGWPRWWWSSVESWWGRLSQDELRSLDAKARVSILNRKLGLKLGAAEPIRSDYRSNFWAVCEALERPVAIADAFQANNSSEHPWHDPRYISKTAALSRRGVERGLAVHPSEEMRFSVLRKQDGKKET